MANCRGNADVGLQNSRPGVPRTDGHFQQLRRVPIQVVERLHTSEIRALSLQVLPPGSVKYRRQSRELGGDCAEVEDGRLGSDLRVVVQALNKSLLDLLLQVREVGSDGHQKGLGAEPQRGQAARGFHK